MYVKNFIDEMAGWAHTLQPSYIGTNSSGWIITGKIVEYYYEWVNDFEATHFKYGKISGNFETSVVAESKEAYDHFVEHHPPNKWDYMDI